jgi:hypothetical protein
MAASNNSPDRKTAQMNKTPISSTVHLPDPFVATPDFYLGASPSQTTALRVSLATADELQKRPDRTCR